MEVINLTTLISEEESTEDSIWEFENISTEEPQRERKNHHGPLHGFVVFRDGGRRPSRAYGQDRDICRGCGKTVLSRYNRSWYCSARACRDAGIGEEGREPRREVYEEEEG